jgi:hypothetical protein
MATLAAALVGVLCVGAVLIVGCYKSETSNVPNVLLIPNYNIDAYIILIHLTY